MKNTIRPYVSLKNYAQIKKIQGYPDSLNFNDALSELLKKIKKGAKI